MTELIDANALLGRLPRQDLGGSGSVDELLASMDRHGIATAFVGAVASWLHDPATGNRELLDLVAHQPRLKPVWVALPHHTREAPPPEEYVALALAAGVAAVRVYPLDHGFALDGRDLAPLLEQLEQHDLPLLVSLAQTTWSAIENVATRHERLGITVCEVGYRTYRQAAGVLGRTTNVRLDLAYLAGHGALEWLAGTFGPQRLVFGTGYPGRDPGEAVTRLLWSELDDAAVTTIGAGAGTHA